MNMWKRVIAVGMTFGMLVTCIFVPSYADDTMIEDSFYIIAEDDTEAVVEPEYVDVEETDFPDEIFITEEEEQEIDEEIESGIVSDETEKALFAAADEDDIPIDEKHFPDVNFRDYVEAFDTGKNGTLSSEEISAVEIIEVGSSEIADLTGIGYFNSLKKLVCDDNNLTCLDVSHNEELTCLDCSYNDLTNLDLSQLRMLEELNCSENQLSSLNVSHNKRLRCLKCSYNKLAGLDTNQLTMLEELDCSGNPLPGLNVSHLITLTSLNCSGIPLSSLDVSLNTALKTLNCSYTQLSSLDVSYNTALTYLCCDGNELTSLDVSHNTALTMLECTENNLTSLDLIQNRQLKSLYCYDNKLESLDVSQNTALTYLDCCDNNITDLDISECQDLVYLYNNSLEHYNSYGHEEYIIEEYTGSMMLFLYLRYDSSVILITEPKETFSVTFNTNGGSEVASQNVHSGKKATKPDEPEKEEYLFGGWYADEGLTTPFNFDTAIRENTTIYAKWISVNDEHYLGNAAIYTVAFDSQYRVFDDIESTPYPDYFYNVPVGTILEPIVKSEDGTLSSDCYSASYSECKFYTERNEWDKIDESVWVDHFPTDPGVYFCKVEGLEPYYGSYEWIDLIRIMPCVTFDSRGGSEVDSQYVLPDGKATEPEEPEKGQGAWVIGGGEFAGWYTDETLNNKFNFNTPIGENITLYAKWYYGFSVCSYDISNQEYRAGGKLSVTHPLSMDDYSYGGSNYTLPEDNITLNAEPDKGFIFKGWYKGEYIGIDGNHTQVSRPLDVEDPDNLLSSEKKYTFYLGAYSVICPVFEVCTDHDFGPDQTIKATTTVQGRIYHVCKNCGTEETIKVLPKLKPAAPTEKITITKKPTITKPTAAKGKITVKWKHFKQTKKTKAIWKKIKNVQVQCAADKGFKNIVKSAMVGKKKKKAVIKGLKKKTTYYVRVRYFDGTGYSAWSKVKKVKTK